jgi:hypothetical protein
LAGACAKEVPTRIRHHLSPGTDVVETVAVNRAVIDATLPQARIWRICATAAGRVSVDTVYQETAFYPASGTTTTKSG